MKKTNYQKPSIEVVCLSANVMQIIYDGGSGGDPNNANITFFEEESETLEIEPVSLWDD